LFAGHLFAFVGGEALGGEGFREFRPGFAEAGEFAVNEREQLPAFDFLRPPESFVDRAKGFVGALQLAQQRGDLREGADLPAAVVELGAEGEGATLQGEGFGQVAGLFLDVAEIGERAGGILAVPVGLAVSEHLGVHAAGAGEIAVEDQDVAVII
jgi:hypothetical protein